jgi:bacterioferritin (cytochrome b1)
VFREAKLPAFIAPIHQRGQAVFFREVVGNPKLHIFMLKHYHYLDGYAAARLKKVVKLLTDPELQKKVERHVVDEDKHAAYFKQRVIELGGSPTLTEAELSLGFLDRFNSHGLGISDERLDEDKFLDVPEIITFFVLLKAEEEFGLKFFLGHLRGADSDPRTKHMLEEIVEDEKRHVSYIAEVLEDLGHKGYRADVEAESRRYRHIFERYRFPVRELLKAIPKVLEMCAYQPQGRTIRFLWFFAGPFLRFAASRA